MAGRLAHATANDLLDVFLGGATYSPPANVYVGLTQNAPAFIAETFIEFSGGGYARVEVPNDDTSWPAAAGRTKANGVEIAFPTATATWGYAGYFVIMDAATDGNLIAWGEIPDGPQIVAGGTPRFPVGLLQVTVP